jgi:hypothetical protein
LSRKAATACSDDEKGSTKPVWFTLCASMLRRQEQEIDK